MITIEKIINTSFKKLLSPATKEYGERIILIVAIISYVAHLLLIFFSKQGFIELEQKFFNDPIAAIYTPFSFILLYEVYLLIFFLPKSITIYIGKQYEIITLIVIRRIFKDIANIELSSDWFQIKYDLQFTFDVVTSLILYFLIYLFYRKTNKKDHQSIKATSEIKKNIQKFIRLKQGIAVILVPILVVLASYTFIHWGTEIARSYQNGMISFKNINNIFFDEFFTILIIVDVLLLLSSFFYSDKFYKIIRNSGFVISTILIKISFSVDGILNNILIVSAVLFGYLILIIHNLYEKDNLPSQIDSQA